MEVVVTRKGQVTIPVELRRRYGIVEGVKMSVEDNGSGIIFRVIPRIEDLAGVDAGKIKVENALEIVEKMRMQDRY